MPKIRTHPAEDILLDYASGAMPLAAGLTVSAHLDACSACQDDVTLYEHIGEQLIALLPDAPLEPDALSRAMMAIDLNEAHSMAQTPKTHMAKLPLPEALTRVGLRRRRYLAPGLWVARAKAPEVDGWRTFLLCLPAGGRVPMHCHRGGELVTVLKGSFNDGRGWRHVGDFAQAGVETEHEIVVSADGPCICLVSSQWPIQWRGWARLLNPILGL